MSGNGGHGDSGRGGGGQRPAGAGRRPGAARQRVAAVCALTLACCAAVLPLASSYAPGPAPALFCAAAVGGAAVTAALRAARLAASTAILAALVVLCGALVGLGTWLPLPAGALPDAVLAAVRYSGARILTTSVPLPVTLEMVALPLAGTWLAAASGAALLASRRPALAALPPVALLAGAIALVGPSGDPAYGYPILLVTALVVLLALTRGGWAGAARPDSAPSRPIRPRTPVAAIVVFTVLATGTTGAAGAVLLTVADRQPPDLRAHVDPPYQNPEQINPLSLLAGWAANPDERLLEVRTTRPSRLRLVTLTEFTGVTWLPAQTYRAAGAVLSSNVDGDRQPTHQEVTVVGLDGGWLPVPDGAREVSGVRVAVDADSATLVAPEGLHEGLRYTVDARLPEWTPERLAGARLATDARYDLSRMVPPGGPGRLYEIASMAAGSGGPYEQATRLADHLRQNYVFDARAPGGNGYPSLDRFLLQPAAVGGRRGTSEQFATAFAILVRSLGMPARVVVGFNVGQPTEDGRYEVRAGDALAWPEVHLDGVGWVPFDPTPEASASDGPVPAPAAPLPTLSAQPEVDETTAPVDKHIDAAAPAGPAPAEPGGWGWLLPLAVALAVLAAVPGARLWRSNARLNRGDPAGRLLGAWAEVRHGLRLTGHRLGRSAAVDDVARLAVAAAGGNLQGEVDGLAGAVNALAFGGRTPAAADTDRLVAGVRAYRRALRRRARRARRLTWWLDPRPLWWR